MTVASEPTVSVVIPTTGRATLLESVNSALAQTVAPHEVVVAVDGTPAEAAAIAPGLPSGARVVATGARSNANRARNVGIAEASGSHIALLDDDDVWLPEKLAQQLAALREHEGDTLAASPVITWDGERDGAVMPARPPLPGEEIDRYLLLRHRLKGAPYFLQTSTWVAPRSIFERLPFDERLGLHQDLDWVLRARRQLGIELAVIPTPLVRYRVAGHGSMSKRSRFEDSRIWALDENLPVSRRARADFLLGTTAVFAAREGRVGAYLRLLPTAVRVGPPTVRGLLAYLVRMRVALRSARTRAADG